MADQFKTFDKAPIVGVVNVKHWSFAVREIIIAGVALFLFVLCLIFIGLYANKSTDSDSTPSASAVIGRGFCTSKECLETASTAMKMMNTSVDPCENFYEYACGNYKTDHPFASASSARTTMNDMRDVNDDRLVALIEKPPTRLVEWAYQKKLFNFFSVCTNDFQRESHVGRPFLEKVVSKLGGWKLLGTWDEDNWDFNTVLKKVQSDFSVDAFYSSEVTIDATSPKQRIISLNPAGTAKWIRYNWYSHPLMEKVRNDYKKFMRRVATLLMRDAMVVNVTAEEQEARLDQFINDTFTIEVKLADAINTTPMEMDPDLEENKMTIGQLNQDTRTVINWVDQLSYTFRPATVNRYTKVDVVRREFYTKLSDIIDSLPEEDKNRMLHNYLIWRCAEKYAQDLSWEYIHANREFYVDMNGYPNFLGIKNYCIYQIHYYMKDALGALYIQEHLADKSQKKVKDITVHLKKALQIELDKTPWMDAGTKKYAKSKLDAVTFKIGYPDWMANENKVDEVYTNFAVNNSDFLGSLINANQFLRKTKAQVLSQGEDRLEWIFGVFDTTIAIYWFWNEITATAGILQNPIYNRDAPHFKTFGSLGAILGRYLHHVVDDWGEHYDKTGEKMGEKSWWSDKSIDAYKPVHKCVRDVYSKVHQTIIRDDGSDYKVALHVIKYTPIAIALTSGIRLAAMGYHDWVKSLGVQEKMLPGIGLSADQMIYLSYAQSYCANRGDRQKQLLIMRGDILNDLKINMALGQLQEFSDAFQCKPKSKMNHEKKCTYY